MKFDHLSSLPYNRKKFSSKKSYFSFEIKSFIFLNFNLQNVLHIKFDSNILSADPISKEPKNFYFFFIFYFFLFFFIFFYFFLFFVNQDFYSFEIDSLRLIFTPTNFTTNKYFKSFNLFFNDLLINIIQDLGLV